MSGTYLADVLRGLGARVPPDVLPELLSAAAQVARMEATLDEMVGWARVEAQAVPRIRRTRATDPRP